MNRQELRSGNQSLISPGQSSPSMTAALLILVMVAVVALLNPNREQFAWFIRLRQPAWITFAGLIPLICLTIYACFYASALLRTTWLPHRAGERSRAGA